MYDCMFEICILVVEISKTTVFLKLPVVKHKFSLKASKLPELLHVLKMNNLVRIKTKIPDS